MSEEKKRFSLNVFLIHITSRKFWIWMLYSYFVNEILHNGSDIKVKFTLVIGWIIVTVIYLIGEPIEDGIGAMFANAKITAELKAGLQKTVTADAAKVIEAAKAVGYNAGAPANSAGDISKLEKPAETAQSGKK